VRCALLASYLKQAESALTPMIGHQTQTRTHFGAPHKRRSLSVARFREQL